MKSGLRSDSDSEGMDETGIVMFVNVYHAITRYITH